MQQFVDISSDIASVLGRYAIIRTCVLDHIVAEQGKRWMFSRHRPSITRNACDADIHRCTTIRECLVLHDDRRQRATELQHMRCSYSFSQTGANEKQQKLKHLSTPHSLV